MNIANGTAKVENPSPHVSIFNFHYATPPDAVAANAHLRGVIGDNETGFRGKDDVLYRTEGWDFLLAGGGPLQQPRLLVHAGAPGRDVPRLHRPRAAGTRRSGGRCGSSRTSSTRSTSSA